MIFLFVAFLDRLNDTFVIQRVEELADGLLAITRTGLRVFCENFLRLLRSVFWWFWRIYSFHTSALKTPNAREGCMAEPRHRPQIESAWAVSPNPGANSDTVIGCWCARCSLHRRTSKKPMAGQREAKKRTRHPGEGKSFRRAGPCFLGAICSLLQSLNKRLSIKRVAPP
jgi:hypothetical protein